MYEPFVWLKCFGITDPKEIEAIRQRVIREVYEQEALYRAERQKNNMPAMNPGRLQSGEFLRPHTPKKKGRKIYLICSDTKERLEWLSFFDYVDERCRECYELSKDGKPCEWPDGVFSLDSSKGSDGE